MRHLFDETTVSELPIFSAFERTAAAFPSQKAIQFEEAEIWTYVQLEEAVNRMSLDLGSMVVPQQHVCVLLPRSPAQVVAILAIAKLGAIYVPIDPELPRSRIVQIISSLPCPVSIALPSEEAKLPPAANKVLIIGSNGHGFRLQSPPSVSTAGHPQRRNVSPDDFAAVLFTSGSTGNPKGVQLTHRNLTLPVRMLAQKQNVGGSSSVLQFSQPSFDMHLVDILVALLHGSSLLQVSQENLMTDITFWIKVLKPTVVHLTPSTISMLEPSQVPSLEHMVTCGEPVTRRIIDTWAPALVLTNLYGPCEASSIVSKRLQVGDDPTVVGRQSHFGTIMVIGEGGTVLPTGVAGDIVVRGGSVFHGYCNADSSSSFLNSIDNNGRKLPGPWYLTGDHGCINGMGELQLLGRVDDQVKVNGQRIELGDITHVIQKHVGRVVVRAHRVQGDTRLFALVSVQSKLSSSRDTIEADHEATLLASLIFQDCRETLPSYMVPRIIPVKSLPQSNSGKIDMQKIRLYIEAMHRDFHDGNTKDPDSLEEQISLLINRQLQQNVPKDANLFEWGMTSMDAMRVIRVITDTTGRQLAFRDLINEPTVERISQLCEFALPSSQLPTSLTRSGWTEPQGFPPSLGQQSIYNACKIYGNFAYICTFAYEITSSADASRLLASVEAVYGRHEAFNCTFQDSGETVGTWSTATNVKPKLFGHGRVRFFPGSETTKITEPGTLEDLQHLIYKNELLSHAEFDLQRDSPVWCSLYQVDSIDEHWLIVFNFHHLVLDEYSLHQFWFEVLETYRHNLQAPQSTAQFGYRQFAELHHQRASARTESDTTWWLERGKSFQPGSLFAGSRPTPTFMSASTENAFLWRSVPSYTVERFLAKYARNSSGFTAWYGLCQVFLYHWVGKRDFLLGVPSSHRLAYPQFMDVLGYCVSVVLVPISLDPRDALSSHITKALADYWDCVAHEQPIEHVLRWLTEAGTSDQPPSLEVMFDYHDRPHIRQHETDEPFRYKQLDLPPRRGSHTALQIHIDNSALPLRLGLEYQTDKFSNNQIVDMIESFLNLLDFAVEAEKDTPISDMSSMARTLAAKPIEPGNYPVVNDLEGQTNLLEVLMDCWREILSTEPDDLHRSFFKAGGDSISAIRFCARAKSKGVLACKVATLYANPTLAALKEFLSLSEPQPAQRRPVQTIEPETPEAESPKPALRSRDLSSPDDTSSSVPGPNLILSERDCVGDSLNLFRSITPQSLENALAEANLSRLNVEALYKPTEMQTSMTLQSESSPGTYISQVLLHFSGLIDPNKLRIAWERVVDAHPSLRTVFIRLNEPEQPYLAAEVKPDAARPMFETMEAETHLSSPEFERFLKKDRETCFEVDFHSLLRIKLLRCGPDENVMILTCHHAVLDGWSLGNIMSNLRDAYHDHPIPTGISFSRVISYRLDQDVSRARTFWRRHLRRARVPRLDDIEAKESRQIRVLESKASQPLPSSLLEAAAKKLQVTPFIIFQAALALALPRADTSVKSAFWTITSGRGDVEGDTDAVGNFLMSIPCVVDVSHSQSLKGWLRDAQTSFQQSTEYDYLPVTELMKCFDTPQSSINALFVFENHKGAQSQDLADNIRLTHVEGHEFSDIAFTLVVEPGSLDTIFTAKYDANSIPDGVTRRILCRFSAIVKNICFARDDGVSVVALADNHDYAEKSYCLQQAAKLGVDYTPSETLLSLFQSAAQTYASDVALSNGLFQITFAELDVLSDKVAFRLREGLGSRRPTVAILLEKSIWTVVAMLGVLKSGSPYCPLEFDAPCSRLDLLIRKINAGALLSNRTGFEKVNAEALVGLVPIDIEVAAVSSSPHQTRLPTVTPDLPCYTIFTSGTTSEPKACVLTHGVVAKSVKEAVRAYGLQASSRVLLFANYVFDASVTDIYGSLSSGACLILLPDEVLKTDLVSLVNRHRISWLHLTPTMLTLLPERSLPTLRTIVLGGEVISTTLRDRWAHVVELIGAYGPTETAVQVMTSHARRESEDAICYQPLPGNLLVLVNDEKDVCHVGEPGEILISGQQLFSGYHGDAAATDSSFTSVNGFDHRRFYKSGDIGQWSSDMKIQILGRKDDRVKVSGMRISPAEVEAVLNDHPAVLRSAVIVHQGRLHAVIQAKNSSATLDMRDILELCEIRLPSRLVPRMTQIAQIPTLPSGKIDRKKLKATIQATSNSPETGSAEKLTVTEAAVGAMICDILGAEAIDADAPLQTMGLDSLGFVQLRGRLAQTYDLDLSYSTVRRARTLRGVSKLLPVDNLPRVPVAPVGCSTSHALAPPKPNPDTEVFPALPSQTTIWLAQERFKDTTYNVQRLLEMDGVTGAELVPALIRVTSGLDFFRTTFTFDRAAKCLQQVFHPRSLVRVEYITLRDDSDHLTQIKQTVQCQRDIFDLARGPLAAFKVFSCVGSRCYLFSNIHHIIVDAYTNNFFLQALKKVLAGDPLPLPRANTGALAIAMSEDRDSDNLARWVSRLRGAPRFLPAASPPPEDLRRSRRYISLERRIPLSTWKEGLTPSFECLLSLFQGLMHSYTHSDDVLVSIPISTRGSTPESAEVLGNLSNTALMRSYLAKHDTVSRFIQRTRDDIDFTLESNLPIGRICSAAGIDMQDHSVSFVFAEARVFEDEHMVERTMEVMMDQRPMLDLTWHVFLHSERLDVRVDFDGSKHAQGSISAIADAYVKFVQEHEEIQDQRFEGLLDSVLSLSPASLPDIDTEILSAPQNTSAADETPGSTFDACAVTRQSDHEEPSLSPAFNRRDRSALRKERAPVFTDAVPPAGSRISSPNNENTALLMAVADVLDDCASRVLSVPSVDRQQNLRELGMDSFASMAFISMVYIERPDLEISILDISEHPTIQALALELSRRTACPEGFFEEASVLDKSPSSFKNGLNALAIEAMVQKALCTSLSIGSVDMDQNLRELGLDSFASMAFISNLYSICPELDINLYDVVKYPTIRSLATYLADIETGEVSGWEDQGSPSESFVEVVALPHQYDGTEAGRLQTKKAPERGTSVAGPCREVPASSIQRHFFLLQQHLGDTTYSLPSLYRVDDVSIYRVLEAVKIIAETHEIFRTTFKLEGDELIQVVDSTAAFPFVIHDLQTKERSAAEQDLRRLCLADCSKEFDLAAGPLFRFTGFILPSQEQFLFLNFHHVIADQQSVANLIRHAGTIATGELSPANVIPSASHTDSAQRQYSLLRDGTGVSARNFWRGVLPSFPRPGWAGLRPDSTQQFKQAASFQRVLEFGSDPMQWAYPLGATSFGALLFTFQLLLAFRSDATGNAVLIPASCRSPKFGEHEWYGCFVNTLPVCLALSGSDDLQENLGAFVSTLAKSLSFAQTPLETILDLNGRKPTDFDVSFVYVEEPALAMSGCIQLAPEHLPSVSTTSKFPITFFVTKVKTEDAVLLRLTVEFNPSLVAEDDARRACSQYEGLLRLLAAREGHIEISELKETVCGPVVHAHAIPYHFHGVKDASIDRLPFVDVQIHEQANQRPHSTALIFENSSTATYGHMAKIVRGLARFLCSSMPISELQGRTVCVVGDVSIERIGLLVALMSLGAAYVPIDYRNPADWNLKIISDCDPACVVFLADQTEASTALRQLLMIPSLVIPTPTPEADTMPSNIPRRSGSDLAYVLYTSGSTGTPKGVAIDHRALKNSLHEHIRIFQTSPRSRWLAIAPWTFDVSVVDMFGPLSVGASLVIGRRDWVFSDLEEIINTHGVTHISTTPTVASLLNPVSVPSIRSLGLGGEPMTRMVRDAWADKIRLMNVYGPTEATVDVITRQVFLDTEVGNIGKPLQNVFAYILDEHMQQVTEGEAGQIAIGGPQLAKGYVKDILGKPSPFVEHEDYGRLYLTGDLGRFEQDGTIVCLGRMDLQVKCRGQRIELGAIERAVNEVLDGALCVAVKITRGPREALAATFTDGSTAHGSPVLQQRRLADSRDAINRSREAVQLKLPSYFMPAYWIPVSNFPRTTNQKLDRKAVQEFIDSMEYNELERHHFDMSDNVGGAINTVASEQSRSDASRQVVSEAFCKVLGDINVQKDSNFFSIGGDSISAIRLATAIRATGASVRVRDIYEKPTVEELSALIGIGDDKSLLPVHQAVAKNKCLLPTTPVMDWFFASQRENENWFNQGHVIKLRSKGFAELQDAWNKIVEIHPMLRMRLVDKSTIEVATFQRDDFVVKRRQLQSMDDFQQHSQELQASLNILSGPITAIGEFIVGDNVFYPMFVHHLAVDVVSWHIIMGDLEDILQGKDILPEMSSFKEWADELFDRQRNLGRRELRANQCAENNSQGPPSSLMLRKNDNASGRFANVKLPSTVLRSAEKHGVQLVDYILAGLVHALAQWNDVKRVELFFETHGRDLHHDKLDTTRTVGWFTFMFPVYFQADSTSRAAEYLAQIRMNRLQAMDNIDHAAPIHSEPGQQSATFNYLGQGSHKNSYQSFEKVHVDTGPSEDPRNIRPFAFDFESSINDGQLNIGVFYSTALHSTETVDNLLGLWAKALRDFGQDTIKENPSIGSHANISLSKPLESHRGDINSSLESQGINTSMVEQVVPATDMQAAMMMSSIGSRSYMHSYDYSLCVEDVDAFCGAWEEVMSSRHSIFRTMLVPLAKVPYDIFQTNLFQVVLTREHARGKFVRMEDPPERVEAEYGRLLSSLYIFRSLSGDLRVKWFCHHALMDAWSRSLVFDEVRAILSGHELCQPPAQYADLASYMHLHSDEHRQFWAKHLDGSEPSNLMEYKSSETGPEEVSIDRHHRVRISVDPADLKSVAARLHTSVPTLYKAAWSLTLAVYLSRDNVTFGAVTAGRASNLHGVDKIVGPCLNTLPMRLEVDWDTTITQYIQYVSDVNVEIAENENISLRKVYHASGKSNLFNTTLMVPLGQFRNVGSKDASKGNAPFEMKLEHRDEVTDVPILLSVENGISVPRTLVLDLRVHSQDFTDSYLLRLLNSFGKSLEHIASLARGKDAVLKKIDLLDMDHHAQISHFVHGSTYPAQYDWTCWELFERQARKSPDKVAVEYHEGTQSRSVTYVQLRRLAELGARKLAVENTHPGDRVALFLDKSVELIASILAVHRLDCVYTPIDVESPTTRIEALIAENRPAAILCPAKLKSKLPKTRVPVLITEEAFNDQKGTTTQLRQPHASLNDAAAVLFTSGTTGMPKGVLMPHRQLVGYAVLVARALGYVSDDRIFGFARPVFDVSQSDIFGTFFVGATLVLTPHTEAMAKLQPLLAKHRITSVNLTPSVASLISPHNLPRLRSLNIAGEVGSRTVVDRWASKTRLVNGYGPCEGVTVLWKHVQPNSDPRNIGKTSIGTEVYLLDEHMRTVPLGTPGTIWIAGHQLSMGYFGRKHDAFRRNPFGLGSIYNTGDCGVYDTSGDVLYLGRKDRQVKINGRRVELSEIENSIAVDEAQVVIILVKSNLGKEGLIAFHAAARSQTSRVTLTKTKEELAKSKALEREAKRRLPDFMVPREFVPISNIPLTGTGKVDESELRRLYESVQNGSNKAQPEEVSPPAMIQNERARSLTFKPQNDHLVPLSGSARSRKPNVFLFYAVTGISLQYRHLAAELPSFNVIGVDNIHLDDPDHYESLESMAKDHADLVRRRQPHGPYILGGFSFAGHIAWVVGQHLRSLGEDVRLVIIDSEATYRTGFARNANAIGDEEWERNFDIPQSATDKKSVDVERFRQALLRQSIHNLKLLNAHKPSEFDGSVLLLKQCVRDDGSGWKDGDSAPLDHGGECSRGNGFDVFVKGVLDVRCVPTTDHYVMLKEKSSVQTIKAAIQELIGTKR